MKRFLLFLAFALAVVGSGWPAGRRSRAPVPPLELVWYVEDAAGEVVTAKEGEKPINPASVVKVATSLWALEKLGPSLVLETRFFARGGVNWEKGQVKGDLVVQGSGDPDFQVENAQLVARALNHLGIREVRGSVVVNDRFWIGWENGSAGTEPDPVKRGLTMAARLRQALDSHRWDPAIRQAWRGLAAARGWGAEPPPSVTVRGGVGADGKANLGELLLVHRSKPLLPTLHRFNAYSNNDIERLNVLLGPPEELSGMLKARLSLGEENPVFSTLSGLGENRLSPRGIVGLLRELAVSCQLRNVALGAVLPVAGCHPGTLAKFFPTLAAPPFAGSVAGKTGTLTTTDGGVAVFAGAARTTTGEYFFCIAAPRAQGRLSKARRLQESWLVGFIQEHGGPLPRTCETGLAEAHEGSIVIPVVKPPQVAEEGIRDGGKGARH